ncbi:type II secretion system minor pseudopilin GspK [Parahaliea mediterranea]|uniref:type II secretion system minor pseudopilin GspK n=1 Tax=Parahaliea mediterranea TaxID=651086 RepID=UPI000E2F9852|nr:type II secretion system minor pseudopilin GspK [Parahaliea mediterranea]
MSCRRIDGAPGPTRQGGAALVIALLVFAICAALMVAMKADFELFYQRGANSFLAEQGYTYLRGAEDLAALGLVLDYDKDSATDLPRDDLREEWALSRPPLLLEGGGGQMRGVRPDVEHAGQFFFIEDLQGRFNLNNLMNNGGVPQGQQADEVEAGTARRYTPEQAQFIRLLQTFEEPALSQQEAAAITDAVLDWMDSDSVPRPFGAEDDYYFAQEPAYRAANRRLASVSELRAVAHITPALYQALAPWVTVWPLEGDSKLNIHTAPARVLQSLNADDDLSPLGPAEAQAIVDLRRNEGFADVDAFLGQGLFAERQTVELKTLLGEKSAWFLLGAVAEVADRNRHLYSVLHRNQRRVESRARSAGEL